MSDARRRTVLLVEDNTDNQIIYRRALEHYGFVVLEAWDGEAAIRIAREELPDIILMDISIPRVNGWEVTRILLADDATKAIPVIALTAHAMPADRLRGSELGFTSYLTKPIEPRRVVEEVERVVRGEEESRSAGPG